MKRLALRVKEKEEKECWEGKEDTAHKERKIPELSRGESTEEPMSTRDLSINQAAHHHSGSTAGKYIPLSSDRTQATSSAPFR